MGEQLRGCDFTSSAAQIRHECFSSQRRKKAMEMKRREVRNLSQRLEIQELIQMLIDVLRNAVHAIDVHVAASGGIHRDRDLRRFSRESSACSEIPPGSGRTPCA